MAFARDTYTGDGAETDFTISFPYLKTTHIVVEVDTIVQTLNTDYTVNTSTNKVVFGTAPANNASVVVKRSTPDTYANFTVQFSDGSARSADDMNKAFKHLLYVIQEKIDISDLVGKSVIDSTETFSNVDTDIATTKAIQQFVGDMGGGDMLSTQNLADLTSASTARTNLGVAIGSDVQGYDAGLADVAALTPTDGNFIVGDGSNWVAESGSTVRSSIGCREQMGSSRTYYVRKDGSDSNTGLVDSAGGAFLTIQKAIDVAAGIDAYNHTINIEVRGGVYSESVVLKTPLVSGGSGELILKGDLTTPSNVVISATSANAISALDISTKVTVAGFKVVTTTSGSGIYAESNSSFEVDNMDFGSCAEAHVQVGPKGYVKFIGNYAVTGNAQRHWLIQSGGTLFASGNTITFSNTPAFSSAFCTVNLRSLAEVASMTFTNGGTVTGPRYSVDHNGVIFTNGGGASYLPGNSAGAAATGGQYI